MLNRPRLDKRRPVLVLSRASAIHYLSTVTVAPITTQIRELPSEVLIGIEEGLKSRSVINADHIITIPQSDLHHYVGSLSEERMSAVCRAIAIALGCL